MNNLLLKWKELLDVRNKLNQKVVNARECFSLKVSDDPTLILITSRNQSYEEEFVVVNTLGENVFAESDRPSSEVELHTLIYQQTDVHYVLQIQTVNNTIITELIGKNNDIYIEQRKVPILYHENEILQYLNEYNVVLIKNKGIVAWGNNIEEIMKLIQLVEFQCEYQVKVRMINMNRSVT